MITGIIVAFFDYRRPYLDRILESYRNHKYILWNNDPCIISGAINSPRNYHSAVKYSVATLAETDHVLIQDNDLIVPPKTIERLYEINLKYPNSIIGCQGRRLGIGPRPYTDGSLFNLENYPVDAIEECEILIGRVQMMRRELLPNILKYMMKYFRYNEDDVIASLANIKAGNKNYVISSPIISLDEKGQGYSYEPRHYPDRNNIVSSILTEGEI